ncbi:MAG: hypothetical protein AB7O52_02985 [Planctomycetota bacterium]
MIECVLAILIVGGALVVGIELMGAHASAVEGQDAALAAELSLLNEVEKVRLEDYDTLATTTFAPDSDYPDVEVCHEVESWSAKCSTVRCVVRWRKPSGEYVTRSVTTLRCEGVTP